jgi:hypothetical protein
MGIFSFLTGNKSDNGMTSKDVVVGRKYRYLAEYADRRYKGYTNCRTLKRKAADKSKGAKKHDYNMIFDAGRDKRALFFVRTDKPIFKACRPRQNRTKKWLSFADGGGSSSCLARLENRIIGEVIKLPATFFSTVKC